MNAARFVPPWRRHGWAALLALGLAVAGPAAPARAHGGPSEASMALSMLPVVSVVGGTSVVLSAGVVLTVVAVEVVAGTTVWVLKTASDGARVSLKVVGTLAQGVVVGVGTVLVGTALSTGLVLSAASEAVAFVPNQIGASLLYNETIVR